jgi:rubrerythrin
MGTLEDIFNKLLGVDEHVSQDSPEWIAMNLANETLKDEFGFTSYDIIRTLAKMHKQNKPGAEKALKMIAARHKNGYVKNRASQALMGITDEEEEESDYQNEEEDEREEDYESTHREEYKKQQPGRKYRSSKEPRYHEKETIKEKEVIKEIVKIRCSHCKQLYEESKRRCPHCGGT